MPNSQLGEFSLVLLFGSVTGGFSKTKDAGLRLVDIQRRLAKC
jgi:hypothetical protein